MLRFALAWGFALATLTTASAPARAGTADRWLADLYDDVAADVAGGAPLVIQVHVPLCDNDIIPCGNSRLGDGDNLRTNLYWATSGGFVGWFGRKGSGWKQVARLDHDDADILEVRVWRRRVEPGRGWRSRELDQTFSVYVVAYAWRGAAIDRALAAFVADALGDGKRTIKLASGDELAAGGVARVVAYVGHNRWMDLPEYDWKRARKRYSSPRKKAIIAVACLTEPYLGAALTAAERVPLLMTTSLLFAGAHSFEGAVGEFAKAGSLGAIRKAAIAAYASGQKKSVKKVGGAFTNPSDRRWRH